MYPKVKVKEEMEVSVCYAYENNSLQSVKAFEWLSLHQFPPSDEYPKPVVRVPGLSIPKSPIPSFRAFKDETNEKTKTVLEDKGRKVRATSAPRPRAVLSSPVNDAFFGGKKQTRKEKISGLKAQYSSPNKHVQAKVFLRCAVAVTPTQLHKKEAIDSKTNVRAKVIEGISGSNQSGRHQIRKPVTAKHPGGLSSFNDEEELDRLMSHEQRNSRNRSSNVERRHPSLQQYCSKSYQWSI